MKIRSVGRLAFALVFAHAAAVAAADLKVVTAFGMRPVLNEVVPEFERTMGHKVTVQYGSSADIKRQIDAGERFDLAILTPPVMDELTKQGKVAAGTGGVLARSGMGVIVPIGAPKPDIGSVEAFKRTLLNAKSIAYAPEGTTGRHMAHVFERLGIAAEMKAKMKSQQNADRTLQAVAGREAEVGFAGISVLLPARETAYVGPFPAELQDYVVYTTGVGSTVKEKQPVNALINFLRSERAASVMKAKGLEPVGPQ